MFFIILKMSEVAPSLDELSIETVNDIKFMLLSQATHAFPVRETFSGDTKASYELL